MKSSTHTHHLPPSGCLCSLLHPSDSGCFYLRCGCVPLPTRWDECFQRQTRQKSPRFYYLAKLSCDGKILLKEWYLNNWSPGALKLQGPAVICGAKLQATSTKYSYHYLRVGISFSHSGTATFSCFPTLPVWSLPAFLLSFFLSPFVNSSLYL